jgi:hypothetical protein
MAQRIEHWLIEKLIPYARNPRTHSDVQIAQIAASVGEFGFNNPIVDTKAGIIAGHGRLLAARRLQLEEVPVIVLDHLTETQKRAYILADNRLALNAMAKEGSTISGPGRSRYGYEQGHVTVTNYSQRIFITRTVTDLTNRRLICAVFPRT